MLTKAKVIKIIDAADSTDELSMRNLHIVLTYFGIVKIGVNLNVVQMPIMGYFPMQNIIYLVNYL